MTLIAAVGLAWLCLIIGILIGMCFRPKYEAVEIDGQKYVSCSGWSSIPIGILPNLPIRIQGAPIRYQTPCTLEVVYPKQVRRDDPPSSDSAGVPCF